MNHKLYRAFLHLKCLIRNPKDWRFYVKGILRELKELKGTKI
jgi:hypothetical protein